MSKEISDRRAEAREDCKKLYKEHLEKTGKLPSHREVESYVTSRADSVDRKQDK